MEVYQFMGFDRRYLSRLCRSWCSRKTKDHLVWHGQLSPLKDSFYGSFIGNFENLLHCICSLLDFLDASFI